MQRRVRPLSERSEMALSPNALRQLEVLRNSETGGVKGSLFGLMNRTRTVSDAKSLLGDAKSLLGDAESSLGDAEISLSDA